MKKNKLSVQANQIIVMTNVLFLVHNGIYKRAPLVSKIDEFIRD